MATACPQLHSAPQSPPPPHRAGAGGRAGHPRAAPATVQRGTQRRCWPCRRRSGGARMRAGYTNAQVLGDSARRMLETYDQACVAQVQHIQNENDMVHGGDLRCIEKEYDMVHGGDSPCIIMQAQSTHTHTFMLIQPKDALSLYQNMSGSAEAPCISPSCVATGCL